jgi:hypothetical protein
MQDMPPGIFRLSPREYYDRLSRWYDSFSIIGFTSLAEIEKVDILPHHYQIISESLKGQDAAFIC